MAATTDPPAEHDVDAFAGRVFEGVIGAFETLAIYVGDRVGLYSLLAGGGALTAEEVADRAGINARYAREWLEQQATAGVLEAEGDASVRLFSLPPAHAAVLADPHSLAYSPPMARMVAAAGAALPALITAYRTGGGVGWSELGSDGRDAQGDINRPWFESALGTALAGVPAVHEVLSRPGARVADIGCGHGWSTIALARAYPGALVEGYDVDSASVDAARVHAEGMSSVSFHLTSGEELARDRPQAFDAVFIFEALHDMPRPVAVLSAARRALIPGGLMVIMDEAVAEDFAPGGGEIDRVMYGYSLFICLPDSMSTPGSVATGTVMRPSVLDRFAREAGFEGSEILPIEGFSAFRFYRLLT